MRTATVAIALVIGLTACGGTSLATVSRPAKASAPRVVQASEPQNGRTLELRPGQKLRVVLHSTYWRFGKATNRGVLRREGTPQVRPFRSCVAGGGCGTVTVTYLAVAPGSAAVRAARTSCGEAMGCTGPAGRYAVRVRVTKG